MTRALAREACKHRRRPSLFSFLTGWVVQITPRVPGRRWRRAEHGGLSCDPQRATNAHGQRASQLPPRTSWLVAECETRLGAEVRFTDVTQEQLWRWVAGSPRVPAQGPRGLLGRWTLSFAGTSLRQSPLLACTLPNRQGGTLCHVAFCYCN